MLLVSASAISLLERFQHANIAEAFVAPTTSVNRARFKPISAPNINGKNSAHRERRLPDCIGLPLRRARLDSLFMSSSAQGDKDQGDEVRFDTATSETGVRTNGVSVINIRLF